MKLIKYLSLAKSQFKQRSVDEIEWIFAEPVLPFRRGPEECVVE